MQCPVVCGLTHWNQDETRYRVEGDDRPRGLGRVVLTGTHVIVLHAYLTPLLMLFRPSLLSQTRRS